MNSQLTVIVACYLLTIIAGFVIFKPKKEVERFIPSNSYQELIGILNATIQREIEHKYQLDYKVKDIKIIYNFQEDLTELTSRIMISLAPPFIEELAFYHDRKYIIQIVMRNVETFLMEYTRQNKIKTM
jgi:hypothetical protein